MSRIPSSLDARAKLYMVRSCLVFPQASSEALHGEERHAATLELRFIQGGPLSQGASCLLGRSLAAGWPRALAPHRKAQARQDCRERAADSARRRAARRSIGAPRARAHLFSPAGPGNNTTRLEPACAASVALLRRQVACAAGWSHAQRPHASLTPR